VLADKARRFRADPDVAAALANSRVGQLSEPTLAPGESLADLRAEELDVASAAQRGAHAEALDQLALDYLFGTR
jgi:xylose isomerase